MSSMKAKARYNPIYVSEEPCLDVVEFAPHLLAAVR